MRVFGSFWKSFALSVCLAASGQASFAGTYHVVSEQVTHIGIFTKKVSIVQDGTNPLNRFTMTRVHRSDLSDHEFEGSLLLMPGGGSNFELYEMAEGQNYAKTLAGFFALRGYDIWGYSPRNKGLTVPQCTDGSTDCSVMAGWGLQTVVEDATFIRGKIEEVHGLKRPIVGGWSLGAFSTTAIINAHPLSYAGAILWEGFLYSQNAQVLAAGQQTCANANQQLAAGTYFDSSYSGLKFIINSAVTNPTGLSAFPGLPPGTTNAQAYWLILSTAQPAPPAYVPGYTLAVGSFTAGLTYTTDARAQELGLQLNDYDSIAMQRDYYCALGGNTTFTSHLGNFHGDVLSLEAGHAFGPYQGDQVAAMGTGSKTRISQPDFGHMDLYLSANHLDYVERPILHWLETHF